MTGMASDAKLLTLPADVKALFVQLKAAVRHHIYFPKTIQCYLIINVYMYKNQFRCIMAKLGTVHSKRNASMSALKPLSQTFVVSGVKHGKLSC